MLKRTQSLIKGLWTALSVAVMIALIPFVTNDYVLALLYIVIAGISFWVRTESRDAVVYILGTVIMIFAEYFLSPPASRPSPDTRYLALCRSGSRFFGAPPLSLLSGYCAFSIWSSAILSSMNRFASRTAIALMICVLAFSALACVASASSMVMGHMHIHDKAVMNDHFDHLQSLSLGVLSSVTLFSMLALVALLWFFADLFSFSLAPLLALSLHGPPRRTKLARILFSLRSPPLLVA